MSEKTLELEHSDIVSKRNILLSFALGVSLTIINLWQQFFGKTPLEVISGAAIASGVLSWLIKEHYDKKLEEIRKKIRKEERLNEKPQIIEIIKEIVHPSLTLLESEIKALEGKNYYFFDLTVGRYDTYIQTMYMDKDFLFRIFSGKKPSIVKKMKKHDKIVSDVKNKLRAIEQLLEKDVIRNIEDMIVQYNRENLEKQIIFLDGADKKSKILGYITPAIINGKNEIDPNLHGWMELWQENKSKLLEMMEVDNVKAQSTEIEKKSRTLLKTSSSLKEALNELLYAYRKDYLITGDEIPLIEMPLIGMK